MIETSTYTETIQKEEVISITCDCCGKITDDENNWASDIETWKHEFGYGSSMDGECITFELCDECVKAFLSTFTHKPIVKRSF